MRRIDVVDFVLLAALWGASFLFMRIAAPQFGALSLMLLRCAIGAVTLLPLLLMSGGFGHLGPTFKMSSLVGVINSAIPFSLFGFAALSVTTGTLSILNATAPIFGAVVAFVWLGEKLTRLQLLGLFIGVAGVIVLVLAGPADADVAGSAVLLAVLAALAAAFAYGIAANLAKRHLSNANALANATGSQIGASLALLIPGLLYWPAANPDAGAWWAVILLGTFCTGIAYILYFRLIKNVGPTRAVTVTFAIPVFGMFFGWIVLNEAVNLLMIIGAVVVVLGCALVTGVIKVREQN
jgi:drug/metabolite transporter (DMT)-like permease